ncbi:MAG TPA: tetratricopeptide repeat protein [Terriglobia bacterium]|nr:tetratricopeptide repeat protein [Terriglobia bacterium]
MQEQELQGRLSQGLEALARADFPEAIELLEAIAVEDSGNAEVWRQLGVCYLETRRPDLAIEALGRSLKCDSQDSNTHYILGNAYGSSGQLERAAACYRRALEIDPEHAKAEEFLMRTESLLESREHYRNGLRLLYSINPGVEDLNQALRELVQSAAIFDGSPARDNLLECARRLRARKSEWQVPFEITPELRHWARACGRGSACVEFENWIGGREAYEEALGYRVADAFVHHALGFCFVELGELDSAVRAWLRVLELDPKYDFARFGRVTR